MLNAMVGWRLEEHAIRAPSEICIGPLVDRRSVAAAKVAAAYAMIMRGDFSAPVESNSILRMQVRYRRRCLSMYMCLMDGCIR